MSIDGRHLKNAPINNAAKSQPLLSTSEKTPKMSVKVFFTQRPSLIDGSELFLSFTIDPPCL